MVFNSFAFFVFFPVVTGLYFLLPHRARWALLLIASCGFYAWFIPAYLLVLGGVIAIDYVAGIGLERTAGHRRKLLLAVSLCANLGVLAVFKYFDFLDENVARLARQIGWNYGLHTLAWALPIGLSFHTFQAMAYTIEVYRGRVAAERHFGLYALYVMFYPQLVAGPIERPQNLLPQLREVHRFDYDNAVSGLRLMAWGLFKKVVVADRLAVLVGLVHAAPQNFDGPVLFLATLSFIIQAFCDFSGYSDIAIGSARVMGFQLMRNFDRPFQAQTFADLWRRWHISLSTWFRDYLYTPMRRSRLRILPWWSVLVLVFILSGLWHGASWTYVVWGGLNGALIVGGKVTEPWRERLAGAIGLTRLPAFRQVLKAAITVSLFSLTCIFFRAHSLPDAWVFFARLPLGWDHIAASTWLRPEVSAALQTALPGLLGAAVIETAHLLQRRWPGQSLLAVQPPWVRWSLYYAGLAALLLLSTEMTAPFIYFQF